LILGGAQVTEIQGPIFQFNVDKLEFAKSINKIIRTIDSSTDNVSTICKDYAVFTVMNSATRDIGSMVHVLFTLYGLHGDWNFILDRMGTVVKADKAFDKILSMINKNQTEYEAFFKEYMTANQQYSPRKNPYAYLTKVDCYAANIANNFDSLTDEFTFIGPMVDDKDVYDNYPNSKGWEPLMPHVNNGAVGFQAEMRAFIFNKDLKYKLDDMKHNVTNRWYVAPHSYTRKQYDMTNAYCVGSDFDVIIKPEVDFDRALAFSIFELSDVYLQNIREVMKVLSGRDADEIHEFYNPKNPGKPKVALVKEVAGQGMMYDNQLFPIEPSGIDKGISIIDMNNMPVLLTANEYRDGAIRAMV